MGPHTSVSYIGVIFHKTWTMNAIRTKSALDSINSTIFMRSYLILWQSHIWIHIWPKTFLYGHKALFTKSSVSAFKGDRETDVSRCHATNYATVVYWKVKPGFGATWRVLEVERNPLINHSVARHQVPHCGLLAYIRAPHCEQGGIFGGAPPRYIPFDPPLKSCSAGMKDSITAVWK